ETDVTSPTALATIFVYIGLQVAIINLYTSVFSLQSSCRELRLQSRRTWLCEGVLSCWFCWWGSIGAFKKQQQANLRTIQMEVDKPKMTLLSIWLAKRKAVREFIHFLINNQILIKQMHVSSPVVL
ncbi:unnamed protein product, partial [Lymnaea stagnalis]